MEKSIHMTLTTLIDINRVADPTSTDSDGDSIPDGWEYCYALMACLMLPPHHWAANPINPHDVNYDGDSDGWYDRKSLDIPAEQEIWDERNFVPSGVEYNYPGHYHS